MSATANDVIAGARLAADALEKLYRELKAQGGSDEDFMDFVSPNASQKLIRKMAECLLPSPEVLVLRRWSTVPIEELELSNRSYNCLKNHEIEYVGQLLACSEYDLLGIPQFGEGSLLNVKEALAEKGLELATQ